MFKWKRNEEQQVKALENNSILENSEPVVSFDQYTQEWDKGLNVICENSRENLKRRRLYNLTSEVKVEDEMFQNILIKERRRLMNDENYNCNRNLFIDNVKNQIYAETYKLLYDGAANNQNISNENQYHLDEKYKTGNSYDDSMISIAAENDPSLLNVFNNKQNIDNKVKQVVKSSFGGVYNNLGDFNYRNDEQMMEEIIDGRLSKQDRVKIDAYSHYAEELQPNFYVDDNKQSNITEQEWKKYRDDIRKYSESRLALDNEVHSPEVITIEENINVEPEKHFESIKPIPEKNYDSFLIKDDVIVRPSYKQTAPLISTTERVQNIKNIEDTNWEKIKTYVKDFNTNQNTVAIGNVSAIVDADNALNVDLNEKFYLTQEQLKKLRDKQATDFKNIVNEYEETLKQHEQKALEKIYDDINAKPAVHVDKSDVKNKLSNQKLASIKAIEENDLLKKQIKELEKKLNEPAKIPPKPEPKMTSFELEESVVILTPTKINEIEEIKEPEEVVNDESANVIDSQPQPKAQLTNESNVVASSEQEVQQSQPQQVTNVVKPTSTLLNKKPMIKIGLNKPQASPMGSIKKPTQSQFTSLNSNANNNNNKSSLIHNTLQKNRAMAQPGSVPSNKMNSNSPMENKIHLNINDFRKASGSGTVPLKNTSSNDEISRIVSLKDAYKK